MRMRLAGNRAQKAFVTSRVTRSRNALDFLPCEAVWRNYPRGYTVLLCKCELEDGAQLRRDVIAIEFARYRPGTVRKCA
jgi:hypothetical protein